MSDVGTFMEGEMTRRKRSGWAAFLIVVVIVVLVGAAVKIFLVDRATAIVADKVYENAVSTYGGEAYLDQLSSEDRATVM